MGSYSNILDEEKRKSLVKDAEYLLTPEEFVTAFGLSLGYSVPKMMYDYAEYVMQKKLGIVPTITRTNKETMSEFSARVDAIYDTSEEIRSGKRRGKTQVLNRMMKYYYAVHVLGWTRVKAAKVIGGDKDHTTVINALKKCEDFYETDDSFREIFNYLFNRYM